MQWKEFQENYLIEVKAESTIDIKFDENTPLFPISKPSISKILKARVLDKVSFRVIREYPIELNADEVRQVQNKLRKLIMRDFQIIETRMPPHFSELYQGEPELEGVNPIEKIG